MAVLPHMPVVIAKITTVYGVKGWVKVHSFTQPLSNFLHYAEPDQQLFCGRGGKWSPIDIDQIRLHGKGIVAHIAGVDDRELARQYCDRELAVDSSALPALDENELYWHQLEGLRVYSQFGGGEVLLGTIDHLIETGANDVMVLRPCAESIDDRERLIPYLPGQFISKIDLDAGRLDVDWDPEF